MTFREASGEVPAAPRAITADIERDCSSRGRVLRIFGTIYASIGVALFLGSGVGAIVGVRPLMASMFIIGSAFGTLGAACYGLGWRAKNHALAAYRDGVECRARVVDVFHDLKVRVNQVSPWRVRYEMETPDGKRAKGTATYWEKPNAEIGQEVIALYDPKHPSHNALWTRLDRIEPARIEETSSEKLRIADVPANADSQAEAEVEADDEAARAASIERGAS